RDCACWAQSIRARFGHLSPVPSFERFRSPRAEDSREWRAHFPDAFAMLTSPPKASFVEENPMPAKSTRAVKKTIAPSAKKKLAIRPAHRCSKSFTFLNQVSIGPGENLYS